MSSEGELIKETEQRKLDRLLTHKETAKRAAELGHRDLVYKLPISNGGEITVYGTSHVNSLDRVRNMESLLNDSGADIVIVEGGNPILEKTRSILDAKPEDVISENFEQIYMAWLALKLNKEIISWDLNPIEWLTEISKDESFSKDEIMGWMLGHVISLLNKEGSGYSKDFNSIRSLLKIGFGDLEILENLGYKIDDESLKIICTKFFGKPLSEITLEDCERVSSPREENRVTNDISRKITNIRDLRAIEVIKSSSQKNQKIFVVGGRDHTITWEPLLRFIFN